MYEEILRKVVFVMVSWGGAIEGAGMVYQLVNPRNGTKLTAMGAVAEAFQTGTDLQKKDAIGEVVQAVGTEVLIEKFGLDSWFGQMAAMMVSKVIAGYIEDMAAGALGLDPHGKIGEKAADESIAKAMKGAAAGITVTGAGVLATKAGIEASGLNSTVMTAENLANIKDTSLLTKADGSAEKEFLAQHAQAVDKQIRNGEIPFMDDKAIRTAGEASFAANYGEQASRLATEDEYVAQHLPKHQHMSVRDYDKSHIDASKLNHAEKGGFLRQEYQTKLAMETGNAELVKNGKAPVSIEHYAAKPSTFEASYDLEAKGGALPLKGASLDILKDEPGMTTNIDMQAYRKDWVQQKASTLQSVPGVGEYQTLGQRNQAAAAAYEAEIGSVQLVRKATAEEYANALQTEKVEYHASTKTGSMRVTNADNADREKASLMAQYTKRDAVLGEQVKEALNNPEGHQQKMMVQQEANKAKLEVMTGIKSIDVAEGLDLTPNTIEVVERDSTNVAMVNSKIKPLQDPTSQAFSSLLGEYNFKNDIGNLSAETVVGGHDGSVPPFQVAIEKVADLVNAKG